MKILVSSPAFCQPRLEGVVERLREFADDVVVNPHCRTLKKEEILELWGGVNGIIAGVEPYTADVLSQAPATLKVITRYGTGYDSVDTEAAAKKGIAVTNTPGVNSTAVADLAVGMMLAIARRIPQSDALTRTGGWKRYVGIDLEGKTLGIIGLGAIGKRVARRAAGFGMRLLAYDPFFDEEYARGMEIQRASIDEILKASDFVTLHAPVTKETEGIINAASLKKMKSSAFLVNTARGELVREEDLYRALKDGTIAGAALDVFREEPLFDSPLFELENVVVTPHLAGHTHEAETGMAELSLKNTIALLSGEPCGHIVNRELLAGFEAS